MELEHQPVASCPTGHGLWLGMHELAAIASTHRDDHSAGEERAALRNSEGAPDALATERFRTCPECQSTLRKDVYKYGSGIVIDVCDEHGVWLDRGEIDGIEAWSEAIAAMSASNPA